MGEPIHIVTESRQDWENRQITKGWLNIISASFVPSLAGIVFILMSVFVFKNTSFIDNAYIFFLGFICCIIVRAITRKKRKNKQTRDSSVGFRGYHHSRFRRKRRH